MGAEVDVTNAVTAISNEGEGGVGGDGHAAWVVDPFIRAREGDLVGAEVDVTNVVFIEVCNEGEGGVG